MTPELFDSTVALNVRAGYFLCQAFARHLIAAKRPGAIVLTIDGGLTICQFGRME
jgi:NAD(P)-dependent dehydrogenase (short-subunit alcohol dehydrogenase family)